MVGGPGFEPGASRSRNLSGFVHQWSVLIKAWCRFQAKESLRVSWLAHHRRLVTKHRREGYHSVCRAVPSLYWPKLDRLGFTSADS